MRVLSLFSVGVLALGSFAAVAQSAPGTRKNLVQKPAPLQVALTPPMGWNSWNFFAGRVTDKDIRSAADQQQYAG